MAMGAKAESRSIRDWCVGFEELYGEADKKRRPEELWIATMAHCSAMGEGIRRVAYDELINSAAHAFCWMCSFVNKCNTTDDLVFCISDSLCEMVYLKYPQRCGYCVFNECRCNPYKMDKQKDKVAKYEELHKFLKNDRPIQYDLKRWKEIFRELYGGRIYMMTLESLGFHFLEEVGEQTKAVRELVQLRDVLKARIPGVDKPFLQKISSIDGLLEEYSKCLKDPKLKKVPDKSKPDIDISSRDAVHIKARIVSAKMDSIIELADTFSWFCAILIKLDWIAKGLALDEVHFNIEKKLQDIYGSSDVPLKCPMCGKQKCNCIFFQ
jgi:hypothetical protein